VARRADFLERLRSVEAAGPVASKDWADRAHDALGRFESARSARRSAAIRRDGLKKRIAQTGVPEALLARAAEIDDLTRGVDRYASGADDLGKRRGELAEAGAQLSVLVSRLGLGADDGRLVAETALMAVE
jgi:hypothetical protein